MEAEKKTRRNVNGSGREKLRARRIEPNTKKKSDAANPNKRTIPDRILCSVNSSLKYHSRPQQNSIILPRPVSWRKREEQRNSSDSGKWRIMVYG